MTGISVAVTMSASGSGSGCGSGTNHGARTAWWRDAIKGQADIDHDLQKLTRTRLYTNLLVIAVSAGPLCRIKRRQLARHNASHRQRKAN